MLTHFSSEFFRVDRGLPRSLGRGVFPFDNGGPQKRSRLTPSRSPSIRRLLWLSTAGNLALSPTDIRLAVLRPARYPRRRHRRGDAAGDLTWGEVGAVGARDNSRMGMRKVGKYEVGRTIGEGTFAKVKFAHDTETGESVAMKVLAKSTILKHKMVDQVGRRTLTSNPTDVNCVYARLPVPRFRGQFRGRTQNPVIGPLVLVVTSISCLTLHASDPHQFPGPPGGLLRHIGRANISLFSPHSCTEYRIIWISINRRRHAVTSHGSWGFSSFENCECQALTWNWLPRA